MEDHKSRLEGLAGDLDQANQHHRKDLEASHRHVEATLTAGVTSVEDRLDQV
jgi:hypothetical protein